MNPAVDEVLELYRERAQTRGLTYDVETEPSLSAVIDAEDLRTILTNLVGNAVKYNRDRGTLRIRAARANGETRIDVADTGAGDPGAESPPHLR